jgi:hypothetical protein
VIICLSGTESALRPVPVPMHRSVPDTPVPMFGTDPK